RRWCTHRLNEKSDVRQIRGFGNRESGIVQSGRCALSDNSRFSIPHSRSKQAKPGSFRPQACLTLDQTDDAQGANYFSSTVAPAASRSFLNFSASSFDTASFRTPPASVRSLASFRPRPVIARTALITSTFLAPALFRITSNSVCASAAGPAAAGPAATITGAAAVTPNFSSIAFTRSITSISDLAATASTICSLVRDIAFTSGYISVRFDETQIDQAGSASAGASAATSPPPCWSATALTTRANIVAGSASTRASMANACSRVGSEASTSTCEAGSSLPSTETSFACSLSLSLANSLIRRPAAPGSSVENAYSSGPTRASLTTSNSVPATARDASVFLTTRKYTPDSRAFLRIAVICSTVVPAYSAATRECAFAATSASSATTSCFWDRLRAIALLQMNSAHGSCRLRSWATPSVTSGTRGVPGGGLSRTTNHSSGGVTICAGRMAGIRLSGRAGDDGDSLP